VIEGERLGHLDQIAVDPVPNVYALGIESANCSLLGRAHDRAEGRLPFLEPGEARRTSIAVTVEEMK
jgi:hypothetical protein